MILRVLVVDAQSEFRRRLFTLLMTSLSDRVLHLKEAADTSAALELAKQEDFDLIFVDRALTELPTLLDTLHKTRPQAFVILCPESLSANSC